MSNIQKTPDLSLTCMVVMFGVVGPFALQVFLPSLPGLKVEFDASYAEVQLTVSLYLLTFACAQLLYGPLADRFGRRRTILVGLAIYIIAPIICASAMSIEALTVGRVLQAIGACAGLMFARVVARDIYGRNKAASAIGLVTMVSALIGSATPMLGGWIDITFGWRMSFWVTSGLGVAVFIMTFKWFPETQSVGVRLDLYNTVQEGIRLLRSPVFLGYAGHTTCTLSAWYAMLAGLPFVMADVMSQPPMAYGQYFPLLSIGYVLGNLVTFRVAQGWGIHRMLVLGTGLALIACPGMVLWCTAFELKPLALYLPMAMITFAHGLSQPAATSAAVGVNPHVVGSATGMMGFGQWSVAAATAQIVGVIQNDTIWPTVAVVIALTTLSMFSYALACYGETRTQNT